KTELFHDTETCPINTTFPRLNLYHKAKYERNMGFLGKSVLLSILAIWFFTSCAFTEEVNHVTQTPSSAPAPSPYHHGHHHPHPPHHHHPHPHPPAKAPVKAAVYPPPNPRLSPQLNHRVSTSYPHRKDTPVKHTFPSEPPTKAVGSPQPTLQFTPLPPAVKPPSFLPKAPVNPHQTFFPAPVKPPVSLHTHSRSSPPVLPPTKAPVKPRPKPRLKPPVSPPTNHQSPLQLSHRSLIAVQGTVFCKAASTFSDSLIGANPLKTKCKSKKNVVAETKTDKNGYFLLLGPKTVTNYGFRGCRGICEIKGLQMQQSVKAIPWRCRCRTQAGERKGKSAVVINQLIYGIFNVGPFAFDPVCPK
ncbi:hypothetical protein HID58_090666, partial [Brassica napus]